MHWGGALSARAGEGHHAAAAAADEHAGGGGAGAHGGARLSPDSSGGAGADTGRYGVVSSFAFLTLDASSAPSLATGGDSAAAWTAAAGPAAAVDASALSAGDPSPPPLVVQLHSTPRSALENYVTGAEAFVRENAAASSAELRALLDSLRQSLREGDFVGAAPIMQAAQLELHTCSEGVKAAAEAALEQTRRKMEEAQAAAAMASELAANNAFDLLRAQVPALRQLCGSCAASAGTQVVDAAVRARLANAIAGLEAALDWAPQASATSVVEAAKAAIAEFFAAYAELSEQQRIECATRARSRRQGGGARGGG